MQTQGTHLSPATTLFLQWLALWRTAMGFARRVALAKKFDPVRAAREAEQLEVWARFCLFTLIGQIASLEANGAALSKEDRKLLSHCRAIAGALAMLCLLAAKMKRDSAGRIGLKLLGTPHNVECIDHNSDFDWANTCAFKYLDSS